MTKAEFSRSPFQPISLSSAVSTELQSVAKTILDANFDRYLTFSGVNPNEWKLAKVKDELRVYSGQPKRRGKRSHFHSGHVDGDSELQSMLFVGSTPGTLDDMMYSVVSSPTADQDNETSHVNDCIVAVLSAVREPTPVDPFTSVAIKWLELDIRRRSMGLVKNRDYIYVEATGVRCLPSGEQLGYHVMHSVGIPQANALPGRVRAKLSVCSFFRQASETSLSIYSMALLDSMSGRVRCVVVPRFVKALLSAFETPQRGKIKKLAQTVTKSYSQLNNVRLSLPDHTCTTCTKRVWGLGSLYSACNICRRYVCSSCRIEKKLKLQTSDQKKTIRKATFCFSCLTDVMTADGTEFSFEEDSNNDPEITRPAYHSVWASRVSRLPSWGLTRNTESSFDFTNTR